MGARMEADMRRDIFGHYQKLTFAFYYAYSCQAVLDLAVDIRDLLTVALERLLLTDLITFLLYITNFTDPVKKLVSFTEQFQNGYSGFERFLEILSIAPPLPDIRMIPFWEIHNELVSVSPFCRPYHIFI